MVKKKFNPTAMIIILIFDLLVVPVVCQIISITLNYHYFNTMSVPFIGYVAQWIIQIIILACVVYNVYKKGDGLF